MLKKNMKDFYKKIQLNVSCTDKIRRIDSLKTLLGISTLHQLKDNDAYWEGFIDLAVHKKVSSELMVHIAGIFGITQKEFTEKCHVDYCQPLKKRCEDFLRVYDYEKADKCYKANLNYIDRDWYEELKNNYYNLMTSTVKVELTTLLNEFHQLQKLGMHRKLWNQDYTQRQYDDVLIATASKRISDLMECVNLFPEEYDSLTMSQKNKLASFSKCMIELNNTLGGEKQKDIDSRDALYAPWKVVLKLEYSTKLTHLFLSENDQSLISEWSLPDAPDSYKGKAMSSARKAELAALELYCNLYGSAEDISILQVTSPKDNRWIYADIATNGRWVDIKNARTSYSSPESYSEHCVPHFKLDRNNKDVSISSFISPYREDDQPIIWLGETTLGQIERLQKQFNSQYLRVTFPKHMNNNFLPAWLFDYPPICYQDRDTALARIRSSNYVFPRKECDIGSGVLANRVISSNSHGTLSSEAIKLELRIKKCGLSRAVLFLHVLDRFCNYSLNNMLFKDAGIDKILFIADDSNTKTPLSLYDPLETVSNLWNLLVDVSEKCIEEARRFNVFRLRGANILQGENPDGSWSTIYAYCGGRRKINNGGTVKCGQNPIYLGKDYSCRSCGRLICHKCGFCSNECKPRQDKWNP